jgi:hypothetical protein
MEFFRKHKLIAATIAIQIVLLPLIIYLVKQQQDSQTQATPATVLYFNPQSGPNGNPIIKNINDALSLDLMVTPASNLISLIKVEINYDPTKIKLSPQNPVTVNTQAFPVIVEGPVVTESGTTGKVQIIVSVGGDQTKVIQTETKVLTLNYQTLSATNLTQVTVNMNNSFARSIAAQDTSTENVLSSASPAYISVANAPTSTPIPTAPPPTSTPTPTLTPTVPQCIESTIPPQTGPAPLTVTLHGGGAAGGPDSLVVGYQWDFDNNGTWDSGVDINPVTHTYQQAGAYDPKYRIQGSNGSWSVKCNYKYQVIVSVPTPTPTVTPTPVPTNVPTPLTTSLDFTGLKLHGLGTGGDNPNPNSAGTLNILRPNRELTVEIYNTSGTLINTVRSGLAYDGPQVGTFDSLVALPNTIVSGNYIVKIQSPYYLRKQIPGFISLVTGQVNKMVIVALVAGDVNLDNKLTIADYDLIMACYSDLAAAKNCDASKKLAADITDDGKVNQDDYNLFLRELSVQTGD